jgi:hypothetical protein
MRGPHFTDQRIAGAQEAEALVKDVNPGHLLVPLAEAQAMASLPSAIQVWKMQGGLDSWSVGQGLTRERPW